MSRNMLDQSPEPDTLTLGEVVRAAASDGGGSPEWLAWVKRARKRGHDGH